jgi:hypothetical protein
MVITPGLCQENAASHSSKAILATPSPKKIGEGWELQKRTPSQITI